jgi:hypothetical protein
VGETIGDVLPSALGVAISPVPIIAVILILLAPHGHARAASVSYLLGWVVGIGLVVVVVTLVVDPVDTSKPHDPSTFSVALKLVIGALFLFLALRSWRGRPRPGQEPTMPSWMSAIADFTPAKALGLGFMLAAANPKNLALAVAGGAAIGADADDVATDVVGVVVFVVVASLSVATPVVGCLVAEQRMRAPLGELSHWLTIHASAVMTVLLLVLGVNSIGNGIAGL